MKVWQSKLNALTAIDLAKADPWLSDFQLDLWARAYRCVSVAQPGTLVEVAP